MAPRPCVCKHPSGAPPPPTPQKNSRYATTPFALADYLPYVHADLYTHPALVMNQSRDTFYRLYSKLADLNCEFCQKLRKGDAVWLLVDLEDATADRLNV